MKLHYITALVAAAAISLGGAAYATGSLLSGSPAPAAPVATAQAPQAAPMPVRPRHTLADMQELQDGISYDLAARTLGTLGHVADRRIATDLGISQGGNVTVYAWPNHDGSRIVLVFQHDRLIQRTHEGLR